MAYLEELLPEFRKGAKIRCNDWEKDLYIYMKNNLVYSSDMSKHLDYDILSDKWEPYQEPIDWQYIIDHKCLCEFWDDEEYSIVGCLIKIHEKIDGMNGLHDYYKFMEENGRSWTNCRPVRKDEVTFYEDKKDE